MNKDYLIALIICKEKFKTSNPHVQGLKYHDIKNSEPKIVAFLRFAATKKNAQYVNFYYKTTSRSEKGRNFAFRRYING
jgi:hypothetical protein